MNEDTKYLYDRIVTRVWSGFDDADDIHAMIDDLLDGDADEDFLRQSIEPEFEKKRLVEAAWEKTTDLDRLNDVFKALFQQGIFCLHDAGFTMSDGHYDCHEALDSYPKEQFFGYCFYHGQDVESAVAGHGLYLAYDHIEGDVPDKLNVAQIINKELANAGFKVNWDGTTNQRISLPEFDWKHRTLTS